MHTSTDTPEVKMLVGHPDSPRGTKRSHDYDDIHAKGEVQVQVTTGKENRFLTEINKRVSQKFKRPPMAKVLGAMQEMECDEGIKPSFMDGPVYFMPVY
jgi:hypothetical protein